MNRQPGAGSAQVAVRRVGNAEPLEHDQVVVEEPLLIRLAWPGGSRAISVTMRTPGKDAELAVGFLFSEGLLPAQTAIRDVRVELEGTAGSRVTVELAAAPVQDLSTAERNFYMTSSCGVCGKASLDAVRTRAEFDLNESAFSVSATVLQELPAQLMARQALFAGTGSIHAAGLFSAAGLRGTVFEDVGRHNALDKLVGNAFYGGKLPLADRGIVVSGRASFELVQKACMAGSPMLAAVGAPSSLAVELAWEAGMTLVGFVKADRFNVYSVPARVVGLA